MKTIIIPKRFGYPTLDITVNGKVYTVKSGEEITIEDHIAEAIENAIRLEPKANPSGYSKIATYTVTKGADGTLPSRAVIDADDNGKAFRIKDFFLKMKIAHTVEGATTGYVVIRGMVDDISDTRCCSGYCQLNSLKNTLNQYYASFVTHGETGGGLLMVSKDPLGLDFKYGKTPNYSDDETYLSPTEPDVSLKDGINTLNVYMYGLDWEETPFAEGCTFELWGVRI